MDEYALPSGIRSALIWLHGAQLMPAQCGEAA
jgi:hypothetical protein